MIFQHMHQTKINIGSEQQFNSSEMIHWVWVYWYIRWSRVIVDIACGCSSGQCISEAVEERLCSHSFCETEWVRWLRSFERFNGWINVENKWNMWNREKFSKIVEFSSSSEEVSCVDSDRAALPPQSICESRCSVLVAVQMECSDDTLHRTFNGTDNTQWRYYLS